MIACWFCAKDDREVKRIFAAAAKFTKVGGGICNECVELFAKDLDRKAEEHDAYGDF